jgi:hypothetical protein
MGPTQRRQERAAFNARIEAVLDRSSEALRSVVHEGGPLLSSGERELLQELVFKLGMARSAMIQGDGDPADVDAEWRRANAWRPR